MAFPWGKRLAEQRSNDLLRFLASVVPTGLGALLQLVVFALTARALGPELFGRLAVVYGVAAIAVELVGGGADEVIIRRASADKSQYRASAGHALRLTITTLPIVGMLALAVAWAFVPELPATVVAALVLADIVLQRAIAFVEKTMVAHHQAVRASFVRLIGTATRALVAVLVFVVFKKTDIQLWAAGSFLQSMLVAGLLGLAAIKLYGQPKWGVLREEVTFGLMYMATHLSRALPANLDRIMLAPVLATGVLGVYAAATRLLIIGTVLLQAALRIYHPRFFVAAAAGREELRAHMISTAMKLGLVGVLAAVAIFFAGILLPVILGQAYSDVTRLSPVIALAMPFIALQYPAGDALTAMGRQMVRMIVSISGAVLFSIGLLVGALVAGVTGAATMFVVGHAAVALALWIAALHFMKILDDA